jgi:hydrogenase expression/formation protein HypC
MCIAIPMQAIEAWSGGALAAGRGRCEHVDTRLVGDCAAGDWLLVFQGTVREKVDAERAAQIVAALDLLEAGLAGVPGDPNADPGFPLPSAMTIEQLAELAGRPRDTGPGAPR